MSDEVFVTRREAFNTLPAAIAAPALALIAPDGAAIPFLNYRNFGKNEEKWQYKGKIFVDGRHIGPLVFLVDPRNGVVGSYDAFGDGKIHPVCCDDQSPKWEDLEKLGTDLNDGNVEYDWEKGHRLRCVSVILDGFWVKFYFGKIEWRAA